MSDPRHGFAAELAEAMVPRNRLSEVQERSRREHCWHDRTYRGEHMDFISKYQQCCHCKRTPTEVYEDRQCRAAQEGSK